MQSIKNYINDYFFTYWCAECKEKIPDPPQGKRYMHIDGKYYHGDCGRNTVSNNEILGRMIMDQYIDSPNK